jgi:pilus assembly protein CpaF
VASALDVVDGEVRELIRRRGLDPFTDPGPVRVLVRDVVADYSERSLTSALPPIGDPESVVRDVLDRVAGFGPLQRYLDDPEVEEVWINGRPTCGSSAVDAAPRSVAFGDSGHLVQRPAVAGLNSAPAAVSWPVRRRWLAGPWRCHGMPVSA